MSISGESAAAAKREPVLCACPAGPCLGWALDTALCRVVIARVEGGYFGGGLCFDCGWVNPPDGHDCASLLRLKDGA